MNTNRRKNCWKIEFLFRIRLSFSSFFASSSSFDGIVFVATCSKTFCIVFPFREASVQCSSLIHFKLPLTDRAMCSIFQLEWCIRFTFFWMHTKIMKINDDRRFWWNTIQCLYLRWFWLVFVMLKSIKLFRRWHVLSFGFFFLFSSTINYKQLILENSTNAVGAALETWTPIWFTLLVQNLILCKNWTCELLS